MGGTLKIKGLGVETKELNLLGVIGQLRALKKTKLLENGQIKDFEFKSDIEGRSYMDLIACKYIEASLDSDAQPLMPKFRGLLRELVSSPDSAAKLKVLGATDLDIALVNGDINSIRDAARSNIANDSYTLAKTWRFLKAAKDDAEIAGNISDLDNIMLSIPGQPPISLTQLEYLVFKYQKLNSTSQNLFIDIQDQGEGNWDYDKSKLWHKALNKHFDEIVSVGTGAHYVLPRDVLTVLNQHAVPSEAQSERDFAFVIIHGHDGLEDGGKFAAVINSFPKLAKHTVYFINSCHSGQYHAKWNSDAFLITGSGADESSSTTDFEKIVDLGAFFSFSIPNAYSIMRFIAENWKMSQPHFTGSFGGIKFHNALLRNPVALVSSEHKSAYADVAPGASRVNVSVEEINFSSSSAFESKTRSPEGGDRELQLVSVISLLEASAVEPSVVAAVQTPLAQSDELLSPPSPNEAETIVQSEWEPPSPEDAERVLAAELPALSGE